MYYDRLINSVAKGLMGHVRWRAYEPFCDPTNYNEVENISLGDCIFHFYGSKPSGNPRRETTSDELGQKIIIESVYTIDITNLPGAILQSYVLACGEVLYKPLTHISASLVSSNVKLDITPIK